MFLEKVSKQERFISRFKNTFDGINSVTKTVKLV
jgi:hypothetical protein